MTARWLVGRPPGVVTVISGGTRSLQDGARAYTQLLNCSWLLMAGDGRVSWGRAKVDVTYVWGATAYQGGLKLWHRIDMRTATWSNLCVGAQSRKQEKTG